MNGILPSSERDWFRGLFGDRWAWLTGEDETGGAYSLLERVALPGARSAPHRHKRIEAFYVLEGEFELIVGDRSFAGGAGTLAVAQEGEQHGWSLVGDREGRMLLLFAPSTPRVYYSELDELLRSAGDSQLDAGKVIELSRRHGII